MVALSGKYSTVMVRGFYASYAAMVKKLTPSKDKELDRPPLLTTLVCEILVDQSEETIR